MTIYKNDIFASLAIISHFPLFGLSGTKIQQKMSEARQI